MSRSTVDRAATLAHYRDVVLQARADAGRAAYEDDVARRPTYHDGSPRRAWGALDPVARWSWSRPAR